MNREMWNVVQRLKDNFSKDCAQFMVTGSLAFNVYGLCEAEDVKDIDIIVIHPNPVLIAKMKAIEESSPIKNRKEYFKALNPNLFRFRIDNFDVDVFVEDKTKEPMWFDRVMINPITDIAKAKKKMNRMKDYIQLHDVCQRIVTSTELANGLVKIKA